MIFGEPDESDRDSLVRVSRPRARSLRKRDLKGFRLLAGKPRRNIQVVCGTGLRAMSSGVVFLMSIPGTRSRPAFLNKCWTKAEQ